MFAGRWADGIESGGPDEEHTRYAGGVLEERDGERSRRKCWGQHMPGREAGVRAGRGGRGEGAEWGELRSGEGRRDGGGNGRKEGREVNLAGDARAKRLWANAVLYERVRAQWANRVQAVKAHQWLPGVVRAAYFHISSNFFLAPCDVE